jgi:hypothetical protein
MFYNDATWEIEAFAMKRAFLLLGLALAGIAFACGDSDGLAFEDVRTHALAALSRPGQVYHGTQTGEEAGQTFTSQVWVDLERDVARVQKGEDWLRIFHEGKIAELSPDGRFQDGDVSEVPGLVKTAALSLDHIAVLFAADSESPQVKAAKVQGMPATLVQVVRPYRGDYEGTVTWRLYLDESFLPLRVDYHAAISGAPDRDWSMQVENEFVEEGSLPQDFFSPEAVRALEVTPADDIARAAEGGLKAYWLGEQFEEMALEDARVDEFDGIRVLNITYRGGGSGPEGPGFGVSISEYTADDWERRMANLDRTPWWEQPTVIKTQVTVQGTPATLYEDPYSLPPLNVGPEGKPSYWMLVAPLGDTVVEILPNVGDLASNPYVDNPEALLRLANSMQPFERPPE